MAPKIAKNAINASIEDPKHPQKNLYEKNHFFICFTIAQGFWNNFCFGVNIIFWPQKGSFSKNMDFGGILGDIHIIKMLQQKMLGCTL